MPSKSGLGNPAAVCEGSGFNLGIGEEASPPHCHLGRDFRLRGAVGYIFFHSRSRRSS